MMWLPLAIVALVAVAIWFIYRASSGRGPEEPEPGAGDTRHREI